MREVIGLPPGRLGGCLAPKASYSYPVLLLNAPWRPRRRLLRMGLLSAPNLRRFRPARRCLETK